MDQATALLLADLEGDGGPGPLAREQVEVEAAIGRVLAEPCHARWPLPSAPLSIMDGYAVRSQDLLTARDQHGAETLVLLLGSESAAGHPARDNLEPGTCVRISTGAVVPDKADAVVAQEDTRRLEVTLESDGVGASNRVAIEVSSTALREILPGRHIRPTGSDVADGELLLDAGAEIAGGDASLLAGTGNFTVSVYRRPRVAILSSGDELVPIGQTPGRGQIVGTNAMLLAAQIREAGGEPVQMGSVADTPVAVRAAIEHARDHADLLIASGGISVGDHDLMLPVLELLGFAQRFRRLALRPGRPTTYGQLPPGGGRWPGTGMLVLALPGNPASTLVAFELFGRPLIRALGGLPRHRWLRPRRLVELGGPAEGDRRREHFVRAKLDAQGRALPLAKQLSGALRSIAGFDALVRVPAGRVRVEAGEQLEALILRE
ncbi:Molybdopterin biosynthesis protein MoeA [Enhygromyxa salina]|uniref:Molybdopterin molybdenumtransferase n=1 Tax=Enhygromyxa salina TaxID=215803 RepID=A0A0C2DAL3_9BACT|nr:gephyrin-like molybdotransferase Glp [Enhygromyxa salina]KIG16922.1 Molybdopterin biosynthesis protein MoeA [Enhygromyxa salina]